MTINKISKTAPKSLGYIGSRGKVEILVDFSNENLEEAFCITMLDLGFSDTSVHEESDKYKGGICTCYMIERGEIDEFNAAYKIAKENSLLEASARDSAITEDDTVLADNVPGSKVTRLFVKNSKNEDDRLVAFDCFEIVKENNKFFIIDHGFNGGRSKKEISDLEFQNIYDFYINKCKYRHDKVGSYQDYLSSMFVIKRCPSATPSVAVVMHE